MALKKNNIWDYTTDGPCYFYKILEVRRSTILLGGAGRTYKTYKFGVDLSLILAGLPITLTEADP